MGHMKVTEENLSMIRENIANILIAHKLDANEDAVREAADDVLEEIILDLGVDVT